MPTGGRKQEGRPPPGRPIAIGIGAPLSGSLTVAVLRVGR
jgi:hypothetical protein